MLSELTYGNDGGRYWIRISDLCRVKANEGDENPDQLELFRRSD